MSCTDACRRPTGRLTHCGACHLTFSGIRCFDMHRRGGICQNPAVDWNMSEKDRVWGFHGTCPSGLWGDGDATV